MFRSRDGAVRSPGRQRKRVEASRAKHRKVEVLFEQSHHKAIEALTKQVRVDEEYMKDLGRIVDNLVLAAIAATSGMQKIRPASLPSKAVSTRSSKKPRLTSILRSRRRPRRWRCKKDT